MNDQHYSSMLQMNQQCKVCGEPAAGFHFGAFTCEGCKSFFGRSYNNLSSISECKNGGQCVINKKNRTSCKACRLRKCLVVGMSKSGSRYGRRSNWFKIHCLLQEQANNNNNLHNNNTEMLHHRTYDNKSPSHLSPSLIHRQFSPFARPMSKHEQEMDEYKTSSPSVSSPESHNSDSSVEISDARLGLLSGLKHKNDAKDFFMPLPFLPPGLMQNSPFAAAAAAAMAAQHAQKFLFPPNSPYFGLYPPQLPIKPEKPESEDMAYSKRFYLDAILQSQRSSPPKEQISPIPEKIVIREKTVSPAIIQDNPIDLSMKSRASSESHMESDVESEDKSIKIEHSDNEDEKIDFSDSESETPKGRTTPLDLTKRIETTA